MAGKTTDRKAKTKEGKVALKSEIAPVFSLPESLPCSEVDFPVLIRKTPKVNWNDIVKESDNFLQELKEYEDRKTGPIPRSPFLKTESEYVRDKVFVYLIPALEEALNKAKVWDALVKQNCFFNGIDHIVQVLWNNNPRYPIRKYDNLHVFNMPWARKMLAENPRPYYPKSWLWPEDYAATLIQKTVRQYFVQREDDVQEMRDFWRKLDIERENPDLETNPLLAKKFASSHNVHKN